LTEEPNTDFLRGYRLGYEESKASFEEFGVGLGAKAEQDRIQGILNMQIQWALESSNRTKAAILIRLKEDISFSFTESPDDESSSEVI
jgi:hypothetical protein